MSPEEGTKGLPLEEPIVSSYRRRANSVSPGDETKGYVPSEETIRSPTGALHSVGFEPTSTNTFELESNPLDRSGTNALITEEPFDYIFLGLQMHLISLSIHRLNLNYFINNIINDCYVLSFSIEI